jgi:uncharacterized protein (DUF433 family)
MPAAHGSLLERITIDSDVRFGKPCIRGHRITVQEILEWLSGGASQQQILADYPQLEPDDFLAVYAYAAAHDFILVSTDSDFERLLRQVPGARVVILRSCDYPTGVAAEVRRRNAIRIAELPGSQDHLIILDQ